MTDNCEALTYLQQFVAGATYTGMVLVGNPGEWQVTLTYLKLYDDPITVTGEGPSYWIARDAAIVNSPLSEEEWGLFPALDDLVARSVMGKVRKLQGKES